MMLLTVLASCFGFIGASANIFQVHKIFKRKSAKDISIISYSILFLGTVVWIFYGIDIRSIPVIITNLTMMVNLGLVIIGWFLYGRKGGEKKIVSKKINKD